MRKLMGLILALMCAACAHTPPVVSTHYGTTSELHLRVVRTLACDKTGHPILATSVTPTVFHRADPAQQRTLEFAKVARSWANTDIGLELTGDGRLKGVNASSAGQGEALLDAAIKLVAIMEDIDARWPDTTQACSEFTAAYGDKPLTVFLEAIDRFDGNSVALEPDVQSRAAYEHFGALFGELCYDKDDILVPAAPAALAVTRAGAKLAAVQPAWQTVVIRAGPQGQCAERIWSARVPVAQLGTPYELHIPAAALFGKQRFEAAFDEAGSLTKLKYGSDVGTEALTSGANLVQQLDRSDAERLAEIKLEADLIAAQQRLVTCQADPTKC